MADHGESRQPDSEDDSGANPEAFSECAPKKIRPAQVKNRSVGNPHTLAVHYVIIPSLLLMIFALIVALIAVSTIRLASCNLDNEELKNNTVHSPEASSTNEVPETKSQYCAPCVPCEEDWIWYRGKCYYFSNDSDTWENSQNFCISHNTSLALIDTQHELDFLLRFKGSRNHWIGLSRTDDNTAWTWPNGTLYNESLFKIKRSSHKNTERVYLNREDVRSQEGTIRSKGICSTGERHN